MGKQGENTSWLIQDNKNCLIFELVNAMPWGLIFVFVHSWKGELHPMCSQTWGQKCFGCKTLDFHVVFRIWGSVPVVASVPVIFPWNHSKIRSPSGNNSNGSRQVQRAENAAGNITWADHRHRPIGIATTNSLGKPMDLGIHFDDLEGL
jgi:hypothetical protein